MNFNMSEIDIQQSILSTIINMFIARNWIDDNFDKYYNLISKNNELFDLTTFENNDKKIVIKFYKFKLNTIKNDKEIETLINTYSKYHKILIVSDLTIKANKQITDIQNFEVFKINEVIRDIAQHHLVPKHLLLSKEQTEQVIDEYKLKKKDMGRIYIDDPMVKYLYAKKDDIIQIIRPSIYSGYSTYYRLVVNNSIYN
jgi:DNA-directed RNA polymerase subunit H (RpoH/RPB5)